MTLRELHYLVALAEKRHFGHAAAACHVGQPTLSMQIKKLEEYLGVSLFERDNHHVSPTPIGDNVVGKARIALEAVAAIRELARQAHEPMDGLLRIGAIPTLAPFLVPDLIPKVKSTFPNLRLLVREATTTILIDAARSYKLDALLLTLPLFQDYLDCQALFHEPLKVALPTGHELAASSAKIDRSALDTRQLLLLTEGHCLRDQVLETFGLAPQMQDEDHDASSLDTLRRMVAAGIGWTLLPALAVPHGRESTPGGGLCIRSLSAPVPMRTVGIAWHRGCGRAAAARTLARFIQANLPAGVKAVSVEPRPAVPDLLENGPI